jgi:hypothetical protein
MMVSTSGLLDDALDWAVAKALGHELKVRSWKDITDTLDPVEDADTIAFHRERNTVRVSAKQFPSAGWYPNPRYSTNWAHGGPIIDRERIRLDPRESEWKAQGWYDEGFRDFFGPTALIAAMRCYVTTKLGDTIDIPEELLS